MGRKDLEEVPRSSLGAEIMNKRIQELIQQATRVIEPDDPDYRHEIFDKKLFAELIVGDVLDICHDIARPQHNGDDHKFSPGAQAVAKLVRKFYGVE